MQGTLNSSQNNPEKNNKAGELTLISNLTTIQLSNQDSVGTGIQVNGIEQRLWGDVNFIFKAIFFLHNVLKQFGEGKIVFLINVAGNNGYKMQNNEAELLSHTIHTN